MNKNPLTGIVTVYRDKNQKIWVSAKDLSRWGFHLIGQPRVIFKVPYYALDTFSGLTYFLDTGLLKLWIQAPAQLFNANMINNNLPNLTYFRPKTPGGFFNYDLDVNRQNDNDDPIDYSVLTTLGLFNHFGVGTNNMVYYNYDADTDAPKWVRLNTTWTLDEPEKIATWRLGDSVTGASDWSGAARFGGIQYATNFNTQPYLITFPQPSFKGEATVPSSVDILVNNVSSQKHEVNSGPFEINNIPVVTGAGYFNVVTEDSLGRTQVVSVPYYASPVLLKPGLTQFSYESGFIRDNYGIDNADYGRFLVTGTYERGLTNQLTMGTHEELLTDQQTAGFSADYLWRQYGVISSAIAASHSDLGAGGLASIGFNRQSNHFSYGVKTTVYSKNYVQIGLQPGPEPANTTNQIFLGYQSAHYGSISISYTSINNRVLDSDDEDESDTARNEIVTANYSRNVYRNTSMMLGTVLDLHCKDNNQVYLSIVIALDAEHALNAYTSYEDHQLQPALEYSKNLPLGNGYGYHLMSANNPGSSYGADVSLRNSVGTYTARAYRSDDNNNYELDASGGVIAFGGDVMLANQITNSFALVQIPQYDNVRVYYQNQLMGRTNARGDLLIPQILPYQNNVVAIDPRDISLDSSIVETEQSVMPYYLSGALVKFQAHHLRSVILHLRTSSGEFVPVGATVTFAKDKTHRYPVGYDGLVYLNDTQLHDLSGEAKWLGHRCYFEVYTPIHSSSIIHLGKVLCEAQ